MIVYFEDVASQMGLCGINACRLFNALTCARLAIHGCGAMRMG